MAPPRKRHTPLGQLLRSLRTALAVDQKGFASLLYVSDRVISRWENGLRPTAKQGRRILQHAERAAPHLHDALAEALGFKLVEEHEPEAPAPAVVVPHAPQPSSEAALRAALDAVLLAACEERDLLPRHARAFAVALLRAVDRLGVAPKRAADIVAGHAKGTSDAG